MRKLTGGDIKDLGLLKHYRIIRKWACKTNGITDADLELLIYFDCLGQFRKRDFEDGTIGDGIGYLKKVGSSNGEVIMGPIKATVYIRSVFDANA